MVASVQLPAALEGIEYTLYRGRHPVTQGPVLLRVHRQQDPRNVARLKRELDLADLLRPEWALRPLAVVRERGRAMLMVEDPGGDLVNLARLAPMGVERFLRIGIRISGAVAEIHRSGLVHKDLKPDHIILDRSDRVRITGFGFATDMITEGQAALAVDALAGTLAYIAPEQTGYVNQSLDTRSDLYSLGVIFFELLTGRLPFCAADASEWIHCHIAREPPRLREHVPGIPEMLEAIVARLLAKAPEDRYQTAAGVRADLSRCLASWRSHGRIETFALATADAPGRFSVPEKLYGRDEEMHSLRLAVDRLLEGGDPAFFLISGHSGVGKSSLVNELGKHLRGKPALLACGKFDQFRSNEPYAAAAQAFQALVRRILSRPAEEVARWRSALSDALGGSGQLIANLVPELELLLGKQPPPPELTAQDAQSHFHTVLARFLSVLAKREHPLILFFDDLQWLDVATLDFIERLASERVIDDLLVIGAYRDNEVGPDHPLTGVLSKIRTAEVAMEEIRLRPLPRVEVDQMLSEALLSEGAAVHGIGDLVHRKTGGNPFFIRQFLSTLEDKGLMRFDRAQAIWSCDIDRARSMHFTDNVVDMMIEKLRRLPTATQAALGTLACLGSTAEIRALELIQEEPRADIHSILAAAVEHGYVVRTDTSYTFVHDRIHEAAHRLIALPGRISTHLRIARLLTSSLSPDVLEERSFEIVNHYNRGADLLVDVDERKRVARLNLSAARRSKAASAPKAAIDYLDAAMRLVGDDPWARCYELAFEIDFERAECCYLLGAAEEAEARLITLGQRAQGTTHAAMVASVRINLYTTLARMQEAVTVGLEYLQSVGIALPLRPTAEEVAAAYSSLLGRIGDECAATLAALPRMRDPQWSAVLDVLATMCSPALFTDPNLSQLIVAQMVAISVAHGNTHASALAYVWVGSIFGSVLQEYHVGAEFARSGMRLLETPGFDRFKARATLVYAVLVLPWTQPLSESRRMNERSLEYALEVGDLSFASYARIHRVQKMLGAGDPLGEIEREGTESLQFALRIRSGLSTPMLAGCLHVISMLRGSRVPEIAAAVASDSKSLESLFDASPPLAIAACWYWITKLTACVHLGDLAGSLQAAERARALLWTSSGEFISAEYHFHAALAHAAAWDDSSPAQRGSIRSAFEAAAAPLSRWSATCPETFSSRAALVAAEQARIEGNESAAMRHYDEAIARSQEHGLVQIEALATARAAHFYDRRGFNIIAEAYWGRCRRCYLAWDARARVVELERLHPQAFAQKDSESGRSSIHLPMSQLDSFAIVRASQALSSEIVLPRLIETLVKQTIEHAGAERGALILLRNGAPHVAADGRASQAGIQVTLRDEPVSSSDLPEAGLRYVLRTGKRLIIDSTASSELLSGDPYAQAHAPRSVLYAPIIKQANLIGALYLENGLAKNAFTPDRITVLEFLASQAAISLENAYLYSDLGRSEAFLAEGQRISHTGSWSWCTATGRVHWSEEHYRLLGLDPAEAPAPTVELFLSRVHPEDRESVRDLIHAHVGRASSFAIDFRVLLPDGTIRFLHGEGRPKPGDSDDPVEYIGTTVDVTDRKRVEDALRDAQADLMRAARLASVGELTASIAHEINQPLAAIIANGTTCINWLAHDPPKIGPARAAAQRVIGNATRAAEIIQSIRAMAQKNDSRMARLDLNDAVREIMVLMSSELRRRSVTVETRYGEDLLPILGSRVQIQQVIVNLIMNAVDAMDGIQDRRRTITVSTRCEDPAMAVTEVSDTGSGMDSATLSRVFEPLYTTKSQGLGIGLSICRSIVAAHDGHISARSVPGEGSSFTFALPMMT
jgi:predicted ATPase/signal transduction histidine kinase/GAF domain-containing protein